MDIGLRGPTIAMEAKLSCLRLHGVKPGLSLVDQILPIKRRITMISTIRPTPPLGLYPHDRLCGQTGINPRSASIKIISKIVPTDIFHSPVSVTAALPENSRCRPTISIVGQEHKTFIPYIWRRHLGQQCSMHSTHAPRHT